jgi:hypothetical protein
MQEPDAPALAPPVPEQPAAAAEDDTDAPAEPGALSLEQIYAKIMKSKVGPSPAG